MNSLMEIPDYILDHKSVSPSDLNKDLEKYFSEIYQLISEIINRSNTHHHKNQKKQI